MVLGAITGVPSPACLFAASNPVEAVTPPHSAGQASTVHEALSKNFFQYIAIQPPVSPPPSPEQDPRTYFAAERTFLAWLRTGLALMGIGFAVARFGLFLREMQPSLTHTGARSSGMSVWVGTGLVALGVVVNLTATLRHVQLIRQLRTGTWRPGRISAEGVCLAVFLAACGAAMAIYLVAVR
jgi:putative membrane protein